MGVSLTLLGLLVGATCPLAFEFAAELTFPLSESVSGSAISGLNNAASLLFLFVAPQVAGKTMNAIMLGTAVACTLLLLPVAESYARMDAEEAGVNGIVATESGITSTRRRSLLDAHQDEIQREFQRVMKEVDDGLNEPMHDPSETTRKRDYSDSD